MNDQPASPTCDRCGYAVGVRRVTLMIQDTPARFHQLCGGCRDRLLELVRAPMEARHG